MFNWFLPNVFEIVKLTLYFYRPFLLWIRKAQHSDPHNSPMFVKNNWWSMLRHTFQLLRSVIPLLYYSWLPQVVVFTGRYLHGKLGKLW